MIIIYEIVSQSMGDKLRREALRLDLMSEIRTAYNYMENFDFLGIFDGVALYQNRNTMEHIKFNVPGA